MIAEIRMPKLGESITEGTIVRWLKAQGEPIEEYEPLLEIETDKVNTEYPSPYTGVIEEIVAGEGETLPVGAVMARIRLDGPLPAGEPAVKATPFIRRLARKYGVDLSQVRGTGPEGEITKADVLAAANGEGVQRKSAQGKSAPGEGGRGVTLHRPSRLRQLIARRMSESVRTIPHAWLTMAVDADPLVRARQELEPAFAERGIRLTYFPFFALAVVEAVRDHPLVNSRWRDDETIEVFEGVHLGVAVARPEGLVVPVLHDAHRLGNLQELAVRLEALIQKARAGQLTPGDVEGGTLTINNTGALGAVSSMSIINPPQAAIVNLEAVRQEVRLEDGRPYLGHGVNISLSFDHRILDGSEAAAFLRSVKDRLEQPVGRDSFG